jgi:site-specific recombinase XerD
MEMRRFSRRVLEHHDYVKRTLLAEVGDKDLCDLSLDDIKRWSDTMKERVLPDGSVIERSPNTRRCDMQRLRGVLKYMCLYGEKCINYQLVIVPKYETVEREFLYECEVQAMIDNACSLRNKFIISLLYSSGIRLSELLSLNRDSINNRRFTVIGKGNKMRICFIDSRTETLMKQYLATRDDASDALIISDLFKDRMSKSNVQLIIKNSAKRANIKKHVTPHILRHSFATNFVRNNGGVRHLSKLLGHASLNTTMIYTHVEDPELMSFYNKFHTV